MKEMIYTILAAIMLTSCTPEPLDIDVPQAPQKPVLAAQFYFDTITQQSAIVVALSKTMSALDGRRPGIDSNGFILAPDLLINGAQITMVSRGEEITFTEGEPGFYYAMNVGLVDYASCYIKALDGTGNVLVEANTYALPEKKFNDLKVVKERSGRYVVYTLEDNLQEQNWYVVNYFTKQKQDSGSYSDPRYVARRLTEQKLDFDLYTDKDFTNGTLTAKRLLGQAGFDTIGVAVSSISEGYYQFLLTQKRYGMLINQIKGEVINFPTNVQGGYGYYSMHKPKLTLLVTNE